MMSNDNMMKIKERRKKSATDELQSIIGPHAIPTPGNHARSVRHNAIVSERLLLQLSIYPIIDK